MINFIFYVNFIMSKTEITWIELINDHIKTRKAAGKSAGLRDVIGDAKTDWVKIKAGNHPKYIKGSSKGRKTKKHGEPVIQVSKFSKVCPSHQKFETLCHTYAFQSAANTNCRSCDEVWQTIWNNIEDYVHIELWNFTE